MNHQTNTKIIIEGIVILIFLFICSCKKQDDWLNVKRQNSSVVPTTLQDLQAVLDNNTVMNNEYPDMVQLGTDNVYCTTSVLNGASEGERNSYIWAADIYAGNIDNDWRYAYQMVEYANIVLDGVAKITGSAVNSPAYNNVKGAALFYRSMAFYNLAQLYCKPYSASSASTDQGIPVRLTSDVNASSVRATIKATYDQITGDLKTAIPLLPVTPSIITRPSQASASALLAKTFLTMEDYTDAGTYANNALQLNGTLLDYNNTSLVSPTSATHFPAYTVGNPEVIFYAYGAGYSTIWPNGTANVDTVLYKSYDNNDLRKTFFYKNKGNNVISYFGSYTGPAEYTFSGIANDEVYLIRAECYARAGSTQLAMTDLNALLMKRWKTGTFIPYTATGSNDALQQILTERRKELPFTGQIRWEDLRRLNKDSRFAKTITHLYNGQSYTLPPNSPLYIYPIPLLEIQTYNLPQNPR